MIIVSEVIVPFVRGVRSIEVAHVLIGRRCLDENFCDEFSPISQICVRRSKRLRGQRGDWCHTSNRGNGEVYRTEVIIEV